jgi:hypothetical protein
MKGAEPERTPRMGQDYQLVDYVGWQLRGRKGLERGVWAHSGVDSRLHVGWQLRGRKGSEMGVWAHSGVDSHLHVGWQLRGRKCSERGVWTHSGVHLRLRGCVDMARWALRFAEVRFW